MKRLFKLWFCITTIFLLIEGCLSGSFQNRQTTIFGSVTDNNTNLPVGNNEIAIWGNNGVLAFQGKILQTIYTDKEGRYFTTINVFDEYHSLEVDNRADANKYRDYLLF